MTARVASPAFTLELPFRAGSSVIAPWQVRSPSSPASFATDQQSPVEPVWHMDLPAGRDGAADLWKGRQQLDDESRAVWQAAASIESLASQLQAPGKHEIAGARAELVAGIMTADAGPVVSSEVVSGSNAGMIERLTAWFRATWNQVQSLFGARSWVETRVGDALVARTALGRTGDQLTAWSDRATDVDVATHSKAVELAMRSRQQLIERIALIFRCATRLATALASPASALMAIPAVWKFFDEARKSIGENNGG